MKKDVKQLSKSELIKFIIVALYTVFCLWMIYYFVVIKGIRIVFTHFFYVPIALAGFWWGRKGILVALLLGAALMATHLYLPGSLMEDILRATMFLGISWVVGTLREKGQNNEQLKDQIEFSENLILDSKVPTFVLDPQHNVVIWNKACEELTGLKAEIMVGTNKHWQAFYDRERPCLADFVIEGNTEDLPSYYTIYAKPEPASDHLHGENWFSNVGGRKRYMVFDTSAIRKNGELIAVIESLQDFTEWKQSEEALRESEEQYRITFEQAAVGIVHVTTEGRVVWANRIFSDIIGYPINEVVNLKIEEIISQDNQSDIEWFSSLLNDEIQRTSLEEQFVRKDGSPIWVRMAVSLVRNISGEPQYFIGVVEDITNRKKAEEATKLAYVELNQIFNTAPEPMYVVDRKFNVLRVNDAFSRMAGVEKAAAVGQKCYKLFPTSWCHTDRCSMNRIMAGEEFIESDLERKNELGENTLYIVTATPFRRPDGELVGIVVNFKDITERRRAQEELQEQKRFSENLIQNLAVPTFVLDSEHNVVIWNHACEELTKVKSSGLIGTRNHWQGFYDHERPCLADLVINGDFENIPQLYSIYADPDFIPEGKHGEGWYPKIGGKERYMFFDAAPIFNSKGELTAAIETLQDLTELKLAQELIQEKNRRMQVELELAAEVQRELLPKELPEVLGLNFAWEFRPSIFLAGDMLDIFQIDENHIGFYILDVMGHGIQAALKSVTLNYLLKPSPQLGLHTRRDSLVKTGGQFSPAAILKSLNERFSTDYQDSSFFTLFYGVLNTQNHRLTFARAGHCPPVVVTENGGIRELTQGNPAIGFLKDTEYQDYVVELQTGDRVYLYTDGITEADDIKGRSFSKERFLDYLFQNNDMSISKLTETVVNEVINHIGDQEAKDDLTLLGIEILTIK